MLCVAVTYVIQAGQEAAVAEHFQALTGPTRAEPGCRFYLVHRSPTDPRRFFLYEQYDDEAALEAHRASEHFQRHVLAGILPVTESRSPELFVPLTD